MRKRESVTFKKNPNGSWQLVFNGSELGISFIIPDDCKIEEYDIKVSRALDNEKIEPYKDVCLKLPHINNAQPGAISINENGGLTFEDGLVVYCPDFVNIGRNKDTILKSDKALSLSSFICLENINSKCVIDKGNRINPDIPQTFNFCDNQALTLIVDPDADRISIKGNMGTNRENGMVSLEGKDISFELNNVTMASWGSLLRLKASDLFVRRTKFVADDILAIDVEPLNSDSQGASLNISDGNIAGRNTTNSTLNATSSTLKCISNKVRIRMSLGLSKDNTITAPAIASENNILEQAQILSHDDLVVENGAIKNSKLAFAKKEDKEYYINEISGFGSESCDLKEIKGTLNGRLEHVSGEGLMIGKDSGIYIIENNNTSTDEKTHKPHCEIRNVKVAKGSQLSVYMATPKGENKSEVTLINNVVNSGTIKNAGCLTITNCELNHAEIIQNDKSVETKCSNSVFSGENSLYCVESIDCSTITNCVLYPESKEVVTPLNIKDEELDGIKNYTKYKELSEAKEIVRNSAKQRDSFEEVEIL